MLKEKSLTYDLLISIQICFPPKCAEIRKHALLMLWVFGSTCRCEQLFSLMKNVELISRTHILLMNTWRDACMRVSASQIKPDIYKWSQQKQYKISQ
jgi:hypothetical protein